MKPFAALLLSSLVFPSLLFGMGGAPVAIPTAKGFSVTDSANGLIYRVEAISPNAFRLTVAPANVALPADAGSILAPDLPVPAYSVLTNGSSLTLRTIDGALTFDREHFRLTLLDAKGKTLYGPIDASRNGGNRMRFISSYPKGERAYGVGNGPLVKNKAESVVANTVTRIPLIWTESGYGVLVCCEKPGVIWERADTDRFDVPGTILDICFFTGTNSAALLDAYTGITGRPPVPPLWALGYLQSRWGYTDYDDVKSKWQEFRKRNIPVDAFIYDYDWYQNDFSWNPEVFPDPKTDLAEAAALGIHFVGIRKPRVNGNFLAEARRNDWILAKGSAGTGDDVDFSKPEVRAWWASNLAPAMQAGVSGWWNDEAEQAFTEYFWMTTAELDLWKANYPDRRFWSINRTFSPGAQRLGSAVWTGDIGTSWSVLRETPQTLLSYGLCGYPWTCCDTGGFTGNPGPELYARWQQESAFTPLMRAHGSFNAVRWPWDFGKDAEESIRSSIEMRYRLLPYLYALAHQAFETGTPPMRPLFWEFRDDPFVAEKTDAWMFGPSILTAPFTNRGGKREVYLPAGRWIPLAGGNTVAGPTNLCLECDLMDLPAWQREGSIVPEIPVRQNTGKAAWPELILRVFPGRDAEFILYEDDGENLGYLRGEMTKTQVRWDERSHELSVSPSAGDFPGFSPKRRVQVALAGLETFPAKVMLNGRELPRLLPGASSEGSWFYQPDTHLVIIDCGDVENTRGFRLAFEPGAQPLPVGSGFLTEAATAAVSDAIADPACATVRPLLSSYLSAAASDPKTCTAESYAKLLRNCLEKLPADSHEAFLEKALPFRVRTVPSSDSGTSRYGVLSLSFSRSFPGLTADISVIPDAPYHADAGTIRFDHPLSDRTNIVFRSDSDAKYLLARLRVSVTADFFGVKRVNTNSLDWFWNGESIPCFSTVGPFVSSNGDDGFDSDFIGETNADILRNACADGKPLKWKVQETARDTQISPGELSSLKVGTAYLAFRVLSPEARNVRLSIASFANLKIWVNGKPVFTFLAQRVAAPKQPEFSLNPGTNTVLVKMSKNGRGGRFTLQFQNSDSQPMADLGYIAQYSASKFRQGIFLESSWRTR